MLRNTSHRMGVHSMPITQTSSTVASSDTTSIMEISMLRHGRPKFGIQISQSVAPSRMIPAAASRPTTKTAVNIRKIRIQTTVYDPYLLTVPRKGTNGIQIA
jgi:hypothetical protein